METRLLIVLLAPFALALLMPWLGARLGARAGWAALLAPVVSFAAVVSIYLLPPEARTAVSWEWVPSLGGTLTFTPDGLALFFGLVVTGVGVLVTFYAANYLDDHHYRDHGKFYCYLLLFMGAMLGTVFSSNLLVLFVAWELTGLTSFLLIGFLHDKHESQRGARMALLTTGLTGLALLAGVVLLRVVYGTYDLTEIIAANGVPEGAHGLLTAAFVCCFIGIAGKSAQFPFHYWLPNAMAAPTPVSAYLHSATMVKLGVFLTARMLPVFNGLESWMPVLTVIGFGTFLLGAVYALLSQDLKAVLAYTTVAQLGLLIGYYGLFTQGVPVVWDYLHIINHVFYKACLFMVVGIIDHSTGTRDLRKLGGLWKKMPLTGVAAVITLAAFAGVAPTTGFLSKEMLLDSALHFRETTAGFFGVWPLAALVTGSVINVIVAVGVFHRVFLGPVSHDVEHHYHAPSFGLQLPPLILAFAALAGGLLAGPFGVFTLSFGVAGEHAMTAPALHLWHGLTPAFLTSMGILVAGGVLYWVIGAARRARLVIPNALRFDLGFDHLVDGVQASGKKMNKALGFEQPYVYLFIVLGTIIAVVAAFIGADWPAVAALGGGWEVLPHGTEGWLRWTTVGVLCVAAVLAAVWKQPIRQLFAVSAIGLGITFYYVLYQAPDLALTQILVESAALLLVLLVVLRLKRDGADHEKLPARKAPMRLLRAGIGAGVGLIMGGGVLFFQQGQTLERAGDFYLNNTLALSKGRNAVNTVVVDFRGWDTLLEITVLVIAATGCLGLLARRRGKVPVRPSDSKGDFFPVPRDLILRTVAIGAFIPLNLFALHIFFRGHNAPGGGFIAGLVTAMSLIILVFVIGVHGLRRLMRFNPIVLAICGVLISIGTAVLPVALGLPMLNHLHGYLGGFYAGSPVFFDLGVFCTVVGVTLKIMLPLMKSIHGLPAFVQEESGRFAAAGDEPIDIEAPEGKTAREGGSS
jgi:multicomponent K+:H+ antiporter subunit A/multicomponent Na+:H+ antiporter subunit A